MSRIAVVLLSITLAGCETTVNQSGASTLAEGEEGAIVSVEVINSLRIPARRVKVTLEVPGHINTEVQNRGEAAKSSRKYVERDEVARIQLLLRRIDWYHVSEDDVKGLDGTSVRMEYRGETFSVWTPSYKTAKRRLTKFVRLKNELFRLAGLRSSGLPQ